MRPPIDTGTVKFAAAGPAEPVLAYETRVPKLDENGTALFNVPLFAAGTGIKDSITVKVAGEPKGLSEFTQWSRRIPEILERQQVVMRL